MHASDHYSYMGDAVHTMEQSAHKADSVPPPRARSCARSVTPARHASTRAGGVRVHVQARGEGAADGAAEEEDDGEARAQLLGRTTPLQVPCIRW